MKEIKTIPNFNNVILWLIISIICAVICGLSCSLFLYLLTQTTNFRDNHIYFIYLIPIVGFFVGWFYDKFGKDVEGGNSLIFSQWYNDKPKIISWTMAPFILISTLLSHLVGASVGREGTAIQMGVSLMNLFNTKFKFNNDEKRALILLGISGAFSAVFGTPWAGFIFSLELFRFKNIKLFFIPFLIITCLISNLIPHIIGIEHTLYPKISYLDISINNIGYSLLCGFLFGLAALLFIHTQIFLKKYLKKIFPKLYFRSLFGGIIFLLFIHFSGLYQFLGLGIPEIVKSFNTPSESYTFFIKILLTTFIISSGFKGGEVTPLFFIGATLGSFLSIYIPMDIKLLAAMGFVGVFSGATKTPIACTIMGLELFGLNGALFILIGCIISYFVSGKKSIYT